MLSGENSILVRAREAKQTTEVAQAIENANIELLGKMSLDNGKSVSEQDALKIIGKYFNDVPENLEDQTKIVKTKQSGYEVKISDILKGTAIGDGDTGLDIATLQTEDTKPYLPTGFSLTGKAGESTVNDGLVMTDGENEYVWVEVPKSLYNNTSYNNNGAKKPANSEDYNNIEECLKKYTEFYRKSTSYSDTFYSTEQHGFADANAYNAQKQKMLKSVYENGGFWVGRYETGIKGTENDTTAKRNYGTDDSTLHGTTGHVPVIKKDVQPYTWVRCTQAQDLAKQLGGNLMFGVQWDLVLKFIEEKQVAKGVNRSTIQSLLNNDSTDMGNYRNASFTLNSGRYAIYNGSMSSTWNAYEFSDSSTTNYVVNKEKKAENTSISDSGRTLLTTGCDISKSSNNNINSKQNIADIAGNVWEWTLEKTSNSNYPCAYRGGNFGYAGSDYPASYRFYSSTTGSDYNLGFRVSLY